MKQAINTRTQEEYDALMRYYDAKGIKWYENRKASSENYWPEYETAMCISFGIHLPEFISYANTVFYKKQGYTIIPYTEFAKANIVEEPDRKTKYEEVRMSLRGKYVRIHGKESSEKIQNKADKIGFKKVLWKDPYRYPFTIAFSPDDTYSSYDFITDKGWAEISSADILSIEIPEEPDYRALYLEGRELLEKLSAISKDKGVAGSTWGDTDYDSLSAVFGYNLCLENIQWEIREYLTKHNDLT